MTPQLLLIGTDHRTAGVDQRARLVTTTGEVRQWLTGRARASVITELFVLATCHRVELYAVTADPAEAICEVRRFFLDTRGVDPVASAGAGVLTGEAAVRHLCRVACGLESLVLGEMEITGQIRRAAEAARPAGARGAFLDPVVGGALRAGGRARAETGISRGAMSAASAAVALAERRLGGLSGRRVLVIGAGPTGRKALARFAAAGPAELIVTSRSLHHARQAGADHGAGFCPLDTATQVLRVVDVALVAVRTPGWWLARNDCARALRTRQGRPLLLLDLSVPRAVDPQAAGLPGLSLQTVDDLSEVVNAVADGRRREIPLVEAIVRAEAARAYERFSARAARTGRGAAA